MDLSNENVIHVKKDDIEYLQFRRLLEYGKIVHCYTLSAKDVDFRRNLNTEEQLKKAENSTKKLCNALNISEKSLIRPGQTHSDIIKKVESIEEDFNNVDGLLTDKANINLMLSFADCTPIYIYDMKKRVIGNIHSGWRGTVQKIGQKAVRKMCELYGSDPEDLLVCLGPCIGKCHFEVEEDVKNIFEETFGYLKRNYDIIEHSKTNNEKYFVDTNLINRCLLEEVGVKPKNIVESGICTACHPEILHSHRKSGDKAGRNVSIMGLLN